MTGPKLRILLRADGDDAPAVAAALGAAGHEVIRVEPSSDLPGLLEKSAADMLLVETGDGLVARMGDTLAENDRLREALSYARTTAHDLAQPLTTIMARSQLLLSKAKPDDPAYKPLKVISDEAEKLADLIVKFQKLKEMAK